MASEEVKNERVRARIECLEARITTLEDWKRELEHELEDLRRYVPSLQPALF